MLNGVLSIALPGSPVANEADFATETRPGIAALPFLAGNENRLAAVAVESLLGEAATGFNPLVLYGPSGAGKSHLARGIALEYRSRYPEAEVLYIGAADFARQYAEAISSRQLSDFSRRFRGARMLVVEDVGLLGGKAAAQQEFVHVLDALEREESRVVVTARWAPGEMTSLISGLRSRLAAGLAVPISLPGLAVRMAILDQFAAQRSVSIPKRAMTALATGLPVSVPELQGALVTWAAQEAASGGNFDVASVERFVAAQRRPNMVDLPGIAAQAARYFALKVSDLKSPSRRRGVVIARGVAMYLARQLTGRSLDHIGAFFGGRDHTTVLHGCRKIEGLIDSDPSVLEAVLELRGQLATG